ncbi:MAG: DUF1592 domain-containing protein [Planctomycetales bacterium]
MIASPEFLYLVEPTTETDDANRELSAHELAARLSYFLWSSLPDAELRSLADSGELLKPAVLQRQTQRMLADPKARRFAKHFCEQWLGLGQMDRVAVNPEYYPRFEDATRLALRQEPIEFFWHVLSENRGALDFLRADYAVLNETLSKHYGVEGVQGSSWRSVSVSPEQHRGGAITMGGFLLANSNGADSHPIFRGKWLLEKLLNDPPPPPPPNVPDLDQADPNFAKLPLKEQLAFHRENAACASCHDKLDPWGLALENFDAVGQWRESTTSADPIASKPQDAPVESNKKRPKKQRRNTRTVRAAPSIDAAVALPGGVEVNGADDLRTYLLEHKHQKFSEGLVRKLLSYALGRSLEWTDRPEVDRLVKHFSDSNYQLSSLVAAIAASESFQGR